MKSPWLNLAADCLDRQPPRHTALIWEGRDGRQERYSFADLVGLTDRMANALEGLGFAPGDRLLLRLGNVPAFPVAFLGAVKAGVLPIPTGPGLSVQELAFRATDSEARGILVAQKLRDLAEAVRERWTGLHSVLTTDADGSLTSLLSGSRPGRPSRPTRPDDPAFIIYTSGTTGHPKGVLHAQRWAAANDPIARLWQAYRPGDVVAATGPLSWIYPLGNAFLFAWRHGITVLLAQGPPPAAAWPELVTRHGVTNLAGTPTFYRQFMAEAATIPASLRHAVSCGEPLPPYLVQLFQERAGFPLLDGIGMSECMTYCAETVQDPVRPGSCGKALPGHPVRVLDPATGAELPPDTDGVLGLHRQDPGLFLEYWRRPAETAAAFQGDYFLTGDVVRRDQDGYYWFRGRADDLIPSPAGTVSPFAVESCLLEHPGVRDAGVVAGAEGTVKAFVVPTPGTAPGAQLAKNLIEYVLSRRPPRDAPVEAEFVSVLPRTPSGKLKRKMLRDLEQHRRHDEVAGRSFPELLAALFDTGAE